MRKISAYGKLLQEKSVKSERGCTAGRSCLFCGKIKEGVRGKAGVVRGKICGWRSRVRLLREKLRVFDFENGEFVFVVNLLKPQRAGAEIR